MANTCSDVTQLAYSVKIRSNHGHAHLLAIVGSFHACPKDRPFSTGVVWVGEMGPYESTFYRHGEMTQKIP